ncbi:MAG: hypothetical protein O7A09_10105 [Proteobacteria bacterium]|nr:hypothetical protein [Pseudomonadota bacterium]
MGVRPNSYERIVLVALLIGFSAMKLATNPDPSGSEAGDGWGYLDVARHVAEGDGLVTSVSVWHMGLDPLPHPSTLYPLWPLLLGNAARTVGLDTAARALPELLYLLSLGLLYLLALRLAETWGTATIAIGRLPPTLNVGHVAILVFGLSPVYARHTSLPFAEGLAFTLSFAALLALSGTRGRRPALWAALAGVLGGLAYLTRSQLIAVPLAVTASLVWVGLHRPRLRVAAGVSAVAAVAVCVPWIVHLVSVASPFEPRMLLDFAAYRGTPELAPLERLVPTDSVGAFLLDRAGGLLVAFHPWRPDSYVASIGPIAYLVPLAALALLVTAGRRVHALSQEEGSVATLATMLVGLAALALTHASHGVWPAEWQFHWRAGLPLVFLIVPALAYLLPRREVPRAGWRIAGLLLTAGSLVYLVLGLPLHVGWRNTPASPAEVALSRWLDVQQPLPVSLSTRARPLSVTGRSNFHWIRCADSWAQTERYFEVLGTDYLIVYGHDERCRFLAGLDPAREPVASFGAGRARIRVFQPFAPGPG